jgi:hypothetical protein
VAAAHDRRLVPPRQRDANARARRVVLELLEDLESASVGKREIEQHQIDRLGPRRGERRGDGPHDGNASAGRLEEDSERVADIHVVLDHENVSRPRRSGHAVRERGSVKKNRLPLPSALSTQIRPP